MSIVKSIMEEINPVEEIGNANTSILTSLWLKRIKTICRQYCWYLFQLTLLVSSL